MNIEEWYSPIPACDKIDIVVDDIDNDNNVSSATKLLVGHSYMSV